MSRLVVIYYHDIVNKGSGYSYQRVEIENFEQQMQYLKDNGYNSLRFEDLDKSLPEKAVLVTFDDGFRTVYENAAPIMRKYGIKGNVFLPTKYIDESHPHFMTWEMICELHDKKEFSVAAHTHSHVDIRSMDYDALKSEIDENNDSIMRKLNMCVSSFCMPYGKYDIKSIQLLKKAYPYKYIFACYYGSVSEQALADRLLPRIGISNDDSMDVFVKKLQGNLNWKGFLQRIRLTIANIKGERILEYDIE